MKKVLSALFLVVLFLVLAFGACAKGESGGYNYQVPDLKEPYIPSPIGDGPDPSQEPNPSQESTAEDFLSITISKIILTPTYIYSQPVPSADFFVKFGDASDSFHILKFRIDIKIGEDEENLTLYDGDDLIAPAGRAVEFEPEEPVTLELEEDSALFLTVSLKIRTFDMIGMPKGTASGNRPGIETAFREGGKIVISGITLDEDLSSLSSCGIRFDLEIEYT